MFRRFLILTAIFGAIGFVGYSRLHSSVQAKNINHVAIYQDKIEPFAVTIDPGEVVEFDPKDGKRHDIAEGRGGEEMSHDHPSGALESGTFDGSRAYQILFKKPGIYFFHDHDNPEMGLTVIVRDPNQKAKV